MTEQRLTRNSTSPVVLTGLQIGIAALACAMGLALILSFAYPTPFVVSGLVFGRVTCSLGFLVTIVGAVVVRYATRYLDGDAKLANFTRFLALSVCSALCMMLADNLLLLAGGWAITSMGLHVLLTHYQTEGDAILAARKKFLISRLGDVALLLAIVSIYRSCGTFSLTQLFAHMQTSHQTAVAAVWWICLAAITKSAQFPFHSWLPDTLASPTPVSALMHAGIINGGGALLLKFSPALVEVPAAGLFLALVGSLTMTVGMVSMWAQTSIKRKLAWSTVSQMGFMTAECGISAFAAALIHVLAHGLYKATSFLDSGTVEGASTKTTPLTGGRTIALLLTGMALSFPIQGALHSGQLVPEQVAVMAMTGLAVGHVLLAMHSHLSAGGSRFLGWFAMVICSQLIAFLSAITFRAATQTLQLPSPHPSLPATLACAAPVVTVFALSVYRAFEADLRASALGRAFHIHSQSGFYIGLVADKLVARIWNPTLSKI